MKTVFFSPEGKVAYSTTDGIVPRVGEEVLFTLRTIQNPSQRVVSRVNSVRYDLDDMVAEISLGIMLKVRE